MSATTYNKQKRKKLLFMARRRLGCGNIRVTRMIAIIRDHYPDMPVYLSNQNKYATLQWFIDKHESIAKPKRARRQLGHRPIDDGFLLSYAWRKLRMEVIVERGRRCECCGATPSDGSTIINVDHIKPRRLYPELALEKDNLQILCNTCNHGKGNWDETDWRRASALEQEVGELDAQYKAVVN